MKLKALLLCTLLTLGLAAVAFGQGSTSPSSQDPSMQSPSQTSPSQGSSSSSATSATQGSASESTFTGSIGKSGGKLVLHAAEGDFKLDDQGQAQSYEGKDVKVTGTLDSSGRTIKVKTIEPASK